MIEILSQLFLYAIIVSLFPWHDRSVLVIIPAWCLFWRAFPLLDADWRTPLTDVAADLLSYPVIIGYPLLCCWTGYHFKGLFGVLLGLAVAICVHALGLLFPRRWTRIR